MFCKRSSLSLAEPYISPGFSMQNQQEGWHSLASRQHWWWRGSNQDQSTPMFQIIDINIQRILCFWALLKQIEKKPVLARTQHFAIQWVCLKQTAHDCDAFCGWSAERMARNDRKSETSKENIELTDESLIQTQQNSEKITVAKSKAVAKGNMPPHQKVSANVGCTELGTNPTKHLCIDWTLWAAVLLQ